MTSSKAKMFRHGHRTPVDCYPNDPYMDHYTKLGFGQLTEAGRRQLQALGEYTRRRYQDWLPKEYDGNHLSLQTTDMTRTILSALIYINGLCPANYSRKPISVRLVDPYILKGLNPVSCTSYYIETANYLTGNESFKTNERFSDIYIYLTDKSGRTITNYMESFFLFDTLNIERIDGLSLPQWTRKVYPDPLVTLTGNFFNSVSHTLRQQRLYMGSWFNEVLEYLENMAKNHSASQKLRIYSAHDLNIAAILNIFKAYDLPFPIPAASSLYIELRETNGHHYVNVWFKYYEDLRKINIGDCDFDCPLVKVRNILKDITIDVNTKHAECDDHSIHLRDDKARKMYEKLIAELV